jgi:hypothetical protein
MSSLTETQPERPRPAGAPGRTTASSRGTPVRESVAPGARGPALFGAGVYASRPFFMDGHEPGFRACYFPPTATNTPALLNFYTRSPCPKC